MTTFLVAYNGSPEARKALSKAASISEPTDTLIIACIIAGAPDMPAMAEMINDEIQDIRAMGKKAIAFIEQGDAPEKIVTIAQDLYCDTIVVGEPRKEKWDRNESTAQKIVARTKVPVLIVK